MYHCFLMFLKNHLNLYFLMNPKFLKFLKNRLNLYFLNFR
jgi:hypothetical protein